MDTLDTFKEKLTELLGTELMSKRFSDYNILDIFSLLKAVRVVSENDEDANILSFKDFVYGEYHCNPSLTIRTRINRYLGSSDYFDHPLLKYKSKSGEQFIDISKLSRRELSRVRGLGKATISCIQDMVEELGYELRS